jgi:hypothetical protein
MDVAGLACWDPKVPGSSPGRPTTFDQIRRIPRFPCGFALLLLAAPLAPRSGSFTLARSQSGSFTGAITSSTVVGLTTERGCEVRVQWVNSESIGKPEDGPVNVTRKRLMFCDKWHQGSDLACGVDRRDR